jgi:SAM-dependent methyltransferase
VSDAVSNSTERDWEEQARDWVAWARRPDHDSYWRYRNDFFDFVPEPGKATLDLGCGEGRVSRDLAERGHNVTGLDVSPTLIAAAGEADPESRYLVADASSLPFGDGDFDLIVAYNMLMDATDLTGAVREAARVLAPGGRMVIAITHPVTNTGRFLDDRPGAPFVLDGAYFKSRQARHVEERDGLRMRFSGWTRPLGAYTLALERAGLLVEAIREPVARRADGTVLDIPYHLWLRALCPAW